MAMIPYEELVSGLTSWRARQGLATGASDYLGEAPRHELGVAGAAPAVAAHAYGGAAEAGEYIDEFSDMDIVAEDDAAPADGGYGEYEASPDSTDMVPLEADDVVESAPAYAAPGYDDDYDGADPHRAATVDSGSFEDPAYDSGADAESQPYAASYADSYGEEGDEATMIGESPADGAPANAASGEFAPAAYDDIGELGEGFDAPPPLETLDVDAGEIEEEYALDESGATMIRDDDGAPPPLDPPPFDDSDRDDDPFA